MEEGSLSIGGFDYHYQISRHAEPHGAPVLFVSGAFQTMATWKRFKRDMKEITTVILCDLPGIGSGDILPHTYSFDFLAKSIFQLLEHLGIEKVCLVAASYGTPIAYMFSSLYPKKVDKLLLMGARYQFSERVNIGLKAQLKKLEKRNVENFKEQVVANLLNHAEKDNILRFKMAEKLLKHSLENMSEDDFLRYIENTKRILLYQQEMLNAPPPVSQTLLATGQYDNFTPPSEAQKISNNIKGSQVIIIDKADHILHLERYRTSIKILRKFYFGEDLEGFSTSQRA